MLVNREIHRLLRYLQVKNRRVRKASHFNVSIAEIHILVELDAGGTLSVNELTDTLLINQSQVSRVLQKLRARHLVAQRSDRRDSRKVLSWLTREGKVMITRIDEVIGEIFNSSALHLNGREQRELAQLFETIAKGFGCAVVRARPNETRLRAAHRQMARILGLLGSSVYGSSMTRAQWSILEAIMRASEPVSAHNLEGFLGVKSALISEILTSFEAHGYIERVRSRENHRVNLIHPTSLGRHYFRRIETQAALRLKKCLTGYRPTELKKLAAILRKFAGEWGSDSIFLTQSLITRPIEEFAELRRARAFALRSTVALGWEEYAPDPLFPDTHEIWGLFDQASDGSLRAICVAQPQRLRWKVDFAACDPALPRNQLNAFIQYCHHLSSHGRSSAPLEIGFVPIS